MSSTNLQSEIQIWLREDRLREDEVWYVVALDWWQNVFLSTSNQDISSENDINSINVKQLPSHQLNGNHKIQSIENRPLIDTVLSSSECVILRPQLVENRDFLFVSRRVWVQLIDNFDVDIIIPRRVVRTGLSNNLRIDLYPLIFQLFYWPHASKAPQIVLKAPESPLLILEHEESSVEKLLRTVWRSLRPFAEICFPDTPELLSNSLTFEQLYPFVRVSYQPGTTQVWEELPLQVNTLRELDLEPRDYKDGFDRCHTLVVEERYRSSALANGTENKLTEKWKINLFPSEIAANLWRFQLKVGDLIEVKDTVNQWLEARVEKVVDETHVEIHYLGWSNQWNESVEVTDFNRVGKIYTNVPKWRKFALYDLLEVGFAQPQKNHRWYRGKVIGGREDFSEIEIEVLDDMQPNEWRKADDEWICRPGTHLKKQTPSSYSSNYALLNNTSSTRMSQYYPGRSMSSAGIYGERGRPLAYGVVGLTNLGNTCFMNSMLQCLVHCPPIKAYFLAKTEDNRKKYELEINRTNPLGTQGAMAAEFASLIHHIYSQEYRTISPTRLKSVIGRYAPQFAGYNQQDSQELMSFLLDGIHEDLNRVKEKPYIAAIEAHEDEIQWGREEWQNYLKRNDSIITEQCMGQLRSHVTCSNPECGHESLTFDPFMSLSVPIPEVEERKSYSLSGSTKSLPITLFHLDGSIPMKYGIDIPLLRQQVNLRGLKAAVSDLCDVDNGRLLIVHVVESMQKIAKTYSGIDEIILAPFLNPKGQPNAALYAYALPFPVSTYRKSSACLISGFTNSASSKNSNILVEVRHETSSFSPVQFVGDDEDVIEQNESTVGSPTTTRLKHRRVEIESTNFPLVLALSTTSDGSQTSLYSEESITQAEIHKQLWKQVKRFVPKEKSDRFGLESNQTLPYQVTLHVEGNEENTMEPLIKKIENINKIMEFPRSPLTYHLVVSWTREGYDKSAARQMSLHKSLQRLSLEDKNNLSSQHVPSANTDITLRSCLEKFTEREQLGENDTWFCPKCKEHVRAFKKFDIVKLPNVLIVHLKRFRYAKNTYSMYSSLAFARDKIQSLVQFPITDFNLNDFLVGPNDGNTRYQLFAVSQHSGGLGGGHYTAVVKQENENRWFYYSDSLVREASEQNIISREAYVLFYLRENTPTSTSPSIPSAI